MIALFSYVNYNGKYKETRTGYCIPIAIYIGKVSKNGSSVDRIVSQVDVTSRILNRCKENKKIKFIAIDPGNTLYLLELDLKVIRCPYFFRHRDKIS